MRPREGRDTHRQCTRPLDFNISTCQLHFFKTAACLGFMSSLILRLHLENTKGFSAPHPTRKEQKAFYLKEHSKRYWLQSQTRLLKAADSLNTQPLPLSWDFLQQSLLQALGTQLLLILQSLHNALYQQREQTSTALVLANRTDRPEVNTTAFCVV